MQKKLNLMFAENVRLQLCLSKLSSEKKALAIRLCLAQLLLSIRNDGSKSNIVTDRIPVGHVIHPGEPIETLIDILDEPQSERASTSVRTASEGSQYSEVSDEQMCECRYQDIADVNARLVIPSQVAYVKYIHGVFP